MNGDLIKELERVVARNVPIILKEPGYAPMLVESDGTVRGISDFQTEPSRIRLDHEFSRVESFIRYVNEFKLGGTQIKGVGQRLTAFIDHDQRDAPSHRTHKAVLGLVFTRQYKAWSTLNGKLLEQADFGDFLEDNIDDIVEPTAIDLVTLAANFQALSNVTFASKINADSGAVRFQYSEEISGGSKDGSIAVPKQVVIEIPIYEGLDVAFRLSGRLKYRVGKDGLKLGISFPALPASVERAFDRVLATVADETGIKPLL